ncbi:uncharacterized protein IL334_003279 [Kwoniella shivajii]|uniref:BZIP domain-containing protein n=1 Tax=Kwoniella shivajii TaxID=564305 RepID=A0ABZ1CX44_9TREE|nr:hypothetical protein IL334_003279 [Kwoniella shivajii]
MDSVLSPNTSAFLNYLNTLPNESASSDNVDTNQTSFPPSAFFNTMPVPGRDTPEDTPPSATEETSISPPDKRDGTSSVSDDSDDEDIEGGKSTKRRVSGAGANKRKANSGHRKSIIEDVEDDDDDSESDDVSGHEDKRAHNNNKGTNSGKGSGKKGGRKSNGEGKEPNKAARRKEQNRAAQKAFRERRENKVKDLEEKVAELEAKSYGASVENENLRGILKRLQEENISLKQSAFTFSMPVNGNTGSSTPTNKTPPSFNIPRPQTAKPPTPPHSSTDDSLKSINEISVPAPNGRISDSPESLVSINSSSGNITDVSPPPQPDLLRSDAYNAFLFGAGRPRVSPVQSSVQSNSPERLQSFNTSSNASMTTSPPSNNHTDMAAIWASLYPQGVEALLADQAVSQAQNSGTTNQSQSTALYGNNITTPFTLLNSQPASMSFGPTGETMWDPVSLSQTSSQHQNQFQQPQQVQQSQQIQQQPQPQVQQPIQNQPQQAHDFNRFAFREPTSEVAAVTEPMNNWNDITDNSVSDFLASLTGNNNVDTDMKVTTEDEAFNAQLQQIFGGNSPSQLFNLGTAPQPAETNVNPFSPNNYLNMSPSPLNSNGQSPQSSGSGSGSGSMSNEKSSYNSPQSSTSSGPSALSTFGPPKAPCEIVHVVDEHGNVVKPSDLWMKYTMGDDATSRNIVDHLLIDDLCDQMRSKATCKDGRMELSVKDAEMMFGIEGDQQHKDRIARMKSRVTNI